MTRLEEVGIAQGVDQKIADLDLEIAKLRAQINGMLQERARLHIDRMREHVAATEERVYGTAYPEDNDPLD